jgi:hypothetical protein
MSPECVSASRFTGPVTWKVFSNCPCGVDASASEDASSTSSPITSDEKRDEIVFEQVLCLFMA